MANKQDGQTPEQAPDSGAADIDFTDVKCVQLGHQSGPPPIRTRNVIPKQWQPPKNESTPGNRRKDQ